MLEDMLLDLTFIEIIVKPFLITDVIDRLAIHDQNVAIRLDNHHLVDVVGTGEAPEIELRDIVVALRRVAVHV